MSEKEIDGVPVRSAGIWLVCKHPEDVGILLRLYIEQGLLGEANAMLEAHFIGLPKRSKIRKAAVSAYDSLTDYEKRLLNGGC